jgi:hypothetical protein
MTTLSRAVPTLEGRALASNLIVLGTVEEGPVSMPDYSTDPPQVHSTFRIAVEDTLRGRAPGASVSVRVLGGNVEELRTEWTCSMREGDRVLLFLTPYYAADREDDTFVPYFRSCYPVSPEGVVMLDGRALLEVHADAAAAGKRDTMNIEGVRSFVEAALQKRDLANAAQPEREPEEPEVSAAGLNAMLHVEPGGARWATLDASEEARRSGG